MTARTNRLIYVGAAGLVALFLAWMLLHVGGGRVTTGVDDWGEFAAAASAAAACWYAAWKGPRSDRIGWTLMGASAASWAAGETVWAYLETVAGQMSPFPSMADAGFLAAIPLEVAALLYFGWGFRKTAAAVPLLDGLIIAGALFFLSWVIVIQAVVRAGGDTFPLALSLAYPAADIIAGVIVLTAIAHSKRWDTPLSLIALGMFAMAVSDSTLVYLSATSSFRTNPLDTGWVAGYVLVGLGAYRSLSRQGSNQLSPRITRLRALVPYMPLGAALAVTAFKIMAGQGFDSASIFVLLAVGLCVLVRQYLAITEVSALSRRLEVSLAAVRDREAKLEHQALHDALTNLANRQLFRDRVEQALRRAQRTMSGVALLFVDLDDFKAVNDTMGHAAGDHLLVAAADRLRESIRPSDTVARLGGDEFGIVLEDLREHADAVRVAKRVLESFTAPFKLQRDAFVGVSVGIVYTQSADASVSTLLRDADAAMYAAKSRGKSRYTVFDESIRKGFVEPLEVRNELARAIEDRELVVHYQPVFDVSDGGLLGAEALVRWSRDGVLVPPAEFIPLAEESGLITALGRFVLHEACRQFAKWRTAAPDHELTLSVNVSAHQLNHPGFADDVSQALADSRIPPERLVLEITENALMLDTRLVRGRLGQLADLGVRLAIDDFGIGYSGLHYLQRFPISVVKIAKAFVDELPNPTSRAMVASIVDLCRNLNIVSVAEGVERESQLAELKALDCRAAQGFLLAKPLTAPRMVALARTANPPARARRRTAPRAQPAASSS